MRLLILITFFLLSHPLLADESCKRLIVSAHPDYPPFHWQQGETLIGASISVTVEILESMGIESVVAYEGPWKRVLRKAELGLVDLIPALKNTEDRKAYLAFTMSPFYYNPVAIFVKNNFERSIHRLEDLSDLHGSINLGDKHGDPIDTFISTQKSMQRVYSMSSNFEMLNLGRTDYFIQGLYAGRDFLNNHHLRDEVKVAKTFSANWVHNGFSKKSNCLHLLDAFDQKLSVLLNSGYVEQKMQEYEKIWSSTHR